jgi:hypothetical protein
LTAARHAPYDFRLRPPRACLAGDGAGGWPVFARAAIVAAFGTAFVTSLGGCAGPLPRAERDAAQPAKTLHAYVVLGEEGRPVARVVTSAADCPAIELDGRVEAMDVRALPATILLRPTRSDPADSKPSAFPVLTCERVVPQGVQRATVEGRVLPLPRPRPERIVVVGDTGCRLKRSDNAFQACNDPAAWPFAEVATAAASYGPDLVIHVGDYHYRENACPPGNAGCAGSPWGYGWDAWEADLFTPAGKLLAAAPWIVVRGNHESCNRAGQGWWRFLDPRPLADGRDCNDPARDAQGDYSEPYAVPLGTAAAAHTQLVVFDSSLAGIAPLAPEAAMYATYRAQLERAFALAERRPQTFFMNHHPILAFAPNVDDKTSPHPGNQALQSVLRGLHPIVLFPPNVHALLAGHVHPFQVVSFSTPQPAQFVSGNGGVSLDQPLPMPFPAGATPAAGAVVAGLVSSNAFGFMTLERAGAGWTMTARDVRGTAVATCALRGKKATCVPVVAR